MMGECQVLPTQREDPLGNRACCSHASSWEVVYTYIDGRTSMSRYRFSYFVVRCVIGRWRNSMFMRKLPHCVINVFSQPAISSNT